MVKKQWEWVKCFFAENFSKNWCSFSGRITRREYIQRNICFLILTALVVLIFVGLINLLGGIGGPIFGLLVVSFAAVFLMMLIVYFSIEVRRMHDLGWSGVVILLNVIPIVNAYIFIKLLCSRGTRGNNKYGEDKLYYEETVSRLEEISICARFKRYMKNDFVKEVFSHHGRLSRCEYFYRFSGLFLIYVIIGTCIQIAFILIPNGAITIQSIAVLNKVINGLFILCVLVFLSYDIKRNHDCGNSGWYSLLIFIPVIDLLYLGKQFSLAGEREANKYGDATTVLTEDGVYLNDDF